MLAFVRRSQCQLLPMPLHLQKILDPKQRLKNLIIWQSAGEVQELIEYFQPAPRKPPVPPESA